MKHLVLLATLLFALAGFGPAAASPLLLSTHYTPAQLAAFCARTGGLFTPGAHYQCATECSARGDGCDVICGDTACVGTAPVRFAASATAFQVLKVHVGGLLPPDPEDNWIVYDKKDPKPKPPPPKDVLDKTGPGGGKFDGVAGESLDDKHKGEIEVLSITGPDGDTGGDLTTTGTTFKKLPGKTKPPTLTLKRGKNSSMDGSGGGTSSGHGGTGTGAGTGFNSGTGGLTMSGG